jgi:small subunit ribosomal protein S15
MPMTKEAKAAVVKKFGKNETDSGTAEVQIALLSERIEQLTEHLKIHKKDNHTRFGLLKLVSQRKTLLGFLQHKNIARYRAVVSDLGIRK